MQFAVLGTGMVGRAIAGKLASLGHDVAMGTRDPAATQARTGNDSMGQPSFATWHKEHPQVRLATFAEAAGGASAIFNAINGRASLDALRAAGDLTGKLLIDISNPLSPSQGGLPQLSVCNDDSLAEQIQKAFPQAKVVKTLNTVTAPLMVDPQRLEGGDHSVFVSGDDAEAKAQVTDLLRSFGWQDIIDLGDITTARGAEMWLPLWLRIFSSRRDATFNLKIVTG